MQLILHLILNVPQNIIASDDGTCANFPLGWMFADFLLMVGCVITFLWWCDMCPLGVVSVLTFLCWWDMC